MKTFPAANNAELMSALAQAVGGDRIELAPGNYGALSLSNVFAPPGVTVVSADPNNPASITRLTAFEAEGLTFDRILFGPWKTFIDGSPDFRFINSTFMGEVDPDLGYPTSFGLQMSNCTRPVVEHCELFNWSKNLRIVHSTDVVVRFNNIHSFSNDAVNFNVVIGAIFSDNWVHDTFDPRDPAAHTDFFQLWNGPIENLTIARNFFDVGMSPRSQTVFMRNSAAEKDPGNLDKYWKNILVEDNVIVNGHVHGITTGATVGLTVRNNTLLRGFGLKHGPEIRFLGPIVDKVVEDNILHKHSDGGQFLVQDTDPNGTNYYGDLFVNALKSGATLADLRALPGGLIEMLGVGAEMTRTAFDLTLEAGPTAPSSSPAPIPEPVPDPDPAPILDDLQAQIDANLGRLNVLEDAHDALVSDMDAKFAALQLLSDQQQAANEAAAVTLALRVTNVETKLISSVTVWRA